MSTTQYLPNLNPETTALILIDLQKGIVLMPTEPLNPDQVIMNAQKLTRAFHKAKAQVILVHVSGAPDGKDMLHPQADEPMMRSSELPKDWASIVEQLTPAGSDLVITKRQWGAFYGTELDLELRRRGVKTIVLGGIATNFGVESTARDAYERGYNLIFASDAMAARSSADHEFALTRIFPRIGKVRQTEEIINALQK
jgi:nicotinamidase-related amidase